MSGDKVVLVVLNWNKPDDTVECLESCRQIDYGNFEIVVVDNHSTDDSARILKARFPDLQLIVNAENVGYAGGNNVGMRAALERGADFVFLLNNDIVVDRSVLKELVQVAKDHPSAGMLAPKVLYYDDRSLINSMGTTMDWLRLRPRLGECNQKDGGPDTAPLRKDILVGCALLVRRGVIERIGMIDEEFFIFHEEADWCFRNLKAGSENLVVPRARIYHKASKTMREFSLLTHYYSSRNFLYMAMKNAGAWQWTQVSAGLVFLSLKNLKLLTAGSLGDKKMARAFFLGVADYFSRRMGKCTREFI